MSGLESLASAELPSAEALAAQIPVTPNPAPASEAQWAQALEQLRFGTVFGDHMGVVTWEDGKWGQPTVVPYGPLQLDPSAAVLHYGQEIFEGIKAYRWDDGSVWTFRPGFNAARMNLSAERMAMPSMTPELFLGLVAATVRTDKRWVPSSPDSALYIRPFMIATEPFLGVRSAAQYQYLVISSPVGPYFKGGLKPISIWVSTEHHRAAAGGTGHAKTGGNYAGSLLPQSLAAKDGYDQVCYLDSSTNSTIEELGGMNVFAVMSDGSVSTPALGTILEGCTRSAIIRLLEDRGITVNQRPIALAELVAGVRDGSVLEFFACGTAAVVVPIGKLGGHLDGEPFSVEIPQASVTESIYQELSGIQRGTIEDRHSWMYRLV